MDIIYARQSLEKRDSISIESQIAFCEKQLPPNNTNAVKVIVDKGYSGKNTQRPGFEEMMDYIKQGVVSNVVVYKLDRISRSLLDFSEMMQVFDEHRVNFISSTERFDTSTPSGRAMISIIMVFAQLERETIQQRITDNYYERGKTGRWLGGPAPYAFYNSKTFIDGRKVPIIEPNMDQMSIVEYLFDEYANTDITLGMLTKKLNDQGVLSARGAPWDSSKISKILRNPAYVKADVDIYHYYKMRGCIIESPIECFYGNKGCNLYGKRKGNERKYSDVTNHRLSISLHDGFIDSKTFLACQYKLDNNQQLKRTGLGTHTWLTGLVKCGYCEYSMTHNYMRFGSQGAQKRRTLICSGRKAKIPCDRTVFSINVDIVETYIETKLKEHIKSITEISAHDTEEDNKTTQEINRLKIEIEKIEDQINNLINALATGNELTATYINNKIAELDKGKTEVINRISELKTNETKPGATLKISTLAEKWSELDIEDKKSVAKYFINKIKIYDTEIEIEWNIVQ